MGVHVVDLARLDPGIARAPPASPARRRRPRGRGRSGGERRRSPRSRSVRARTVAPRSAARSASSRTMIPPPSPITKPSRRRSKGSEIPASEVAPMRGECGDRQRGHPGLGTADHARGDVAALDHPHAGANRLGAGGAGRDGAVALAAKAVAHRDCARGRVRPSSAARRAATSPARPARASPCADPRSSRSRRSRFRSRSRSRSRRRAAHRPSPAWAIASSPATSANWVKRSVRRASRRLRKSVGSNSGSARRRPRSPTRRPPSVRCSVVAPTPSGLTEPSPVITTLAGHVRRCETSSTTSFTVSTFSRSESWTSIPYSSSIDLGELDQVERVDVEVSELRSAGESLAVLAELDQRVDHASFELLLGCVCGVRHVAVPFGR